MKYKYQFQVGLGLPQSCTVYAKSYEEAKTKCATVMDRRYEKSGKEPPVTYDIFLLRTNDPFHTSQRKRRYE